MPRAPPASVSLLGAAKAVVGAAKAAGVVAVAVAANEGVGAALWTPHVGAAEVVPPRASEASVACALA